MLVIDTTSSTPPFEQLRTQLIAEIDNGELRPGAKLPAVRKMAAELGLAANTVARTYRELEAAGYVKTQGRNGTIVTGGVGDVSAHERALALTDEYIAAMRALDADRGTLLGYIQRNWPDVEA